MKTYISVLKLFIVTSLLLCFFRVNAQGNAETNFEWNLFIFLIIFSLIILLLFIIISVKTKEIIYKNRKRKINRTKNGRVSLKVLKRMRDTAVYRL
jgi:Na+/melibiose symporter-like transporter